LFNRGIAHIIFIINRQLPLLQYSKITGTDPKAQKGGRGIVLLFLDLGNTRRWAVSTTPRPLYPRV
jgi:hypothetical protein